MLLHLKRRNGIKHKTYRNTLLAFACWVKKVSVGGGAIFIRKICASALFINPQMDPYKVLHGSRTMWAEWVF